MLTHVSWVPALALDLTCVASVSHSLLSGYKIIRLIIIGVAGWPEQLGGHIYGEGPIPPSIAQLIHDFLIQDVGEWHTQVHSDPSFYPLRWAHPRTPTNLVLPLHPHRAERGRGYRSGGGRGGSAIESGFRREKVASTVIAARANHAPPSFEQIAWHVQDTLQPADLTDLGSFAHHEEELTEDDIV